MTEEHPTHEEMLEIAAQREAENEEQKEEQQNTENLVIHTL
jgi:hypothetical protein